jgi:hypothetical protein
VKSARSLKLAGVLVAAALTAAGLSACQPRVGAAAFVGSTRISESTVGKYVTRNATETTDQSTGQPENPKSEVLTSLIITALADKLFQAKDGGPPSAAALDKARAASLTQIGVTSLAALEAAAEPSGFTKAYASAYLDESAKISILQTELKDTDGSILVKAINDLHQKVSVSPRYGDWQPNSLSVTAGPSTPSFLQLAAAGSPSGVGDPTGG